jgi:hypothetical protein
MNEETQLRERFEDLRADLGRRTPSFRSVVERRPQRLALRLPIAAALFLMLLLAITVIVLKSRVSQERFSSADLAAARSISTWHSPTDFLLRTPGHELLDSVPAVTSIRIPPALLPPKGVSR